MSLDEWFLTRAERGNDATDIDRRHASGEAWTTGNDVEVLVDGATYFARLYESLTRATRGDEVFFTDWRGDPDERIDGPGSEIAKVLAECSHRGVDVRGLVWRSHSDKMHFSEKENLEFVAAINKAGGEVHLDERVHHAGSHHQKLVALPDRAFIGGIDLCHGRHDDALHDGDPQAIELDPRYGSHPAWHDVHARVIGPAVEDLVWSFRERWSDPAPLDHRNPWRRLLERRADEPPKCDPLPPPRKHPRTDGTHAVQVLRTYPARRPPYPFAPRGERSVARAYIKAFARARELIYIEDQYLWSPAAADAICDALRREPRLRVCAIVPRYPDRAGFFSQPPYALGQRRVIDKLRAAGGSRVAFFDLENERGRPIYVHAKVCVVDDTWLVIGSDNLNRRSWTNDSELSIAVLDEQGTLARDTRLRLWAEHTQGADLPDDPIDGFEMLVKHTAPPSRLRVHDAPPVASWSRWWAELCYRTFVDPDGRPLRMRMRDEL